MSAVEFPHRVQSLKDQLDQLNGNGLDHDLTAKQSRDLVKAIGLSQIDLWEYVLRINRSFSTIVKAVWAIAATVIGAVLIWFLTFVLPEVLKHVGTP